MRDALELCTALYGPRASRGLARRVRRSILDARLHIPVSERGGLDQRDSVLITYPDMVREEGRRPLVSLAELCRAHLKGIVSTVHILPFYPSSSDGGFSVIDHRAVDRALGGWRDIRALHGDFRLMVDAVFNHFSAHSRWFTRFLRGDPRFRRAFIAVDGQPDLSAVFRPRSSPLLTNFPSPSGDRRVWTTFSADQVDLNYGDPEVLARMVDLLLFLATRGADLIRLDAVAYLWKRQGSPCVHLPQTHLLVRLFRAVLDAAAPHVSIVTETNVPHELNVSYFGNGTDEAQLVYNFALPPLVLHAFYSESAAVLSRWAAGLSTPSPETTFLNFLASHDGIGLTPVQGILSEQDIEDLVRSAAARGGLVSYRADRGGPRPYELNVNLLDALSDAGAGPGERRVDRFLTAHAIMLSLRGVPAVYFHSLFGSTGWPEGVRRTGSSRSINRERCNLPGLMKELSDADSVRARIFSGMKALLRARSSSACFHPLGAQRVIPGPEEVFAVLRTEPQGNGKILCLHNVSGRAVSFRLHARDVFGRPPRALHDVISGAEEAAAGTIRLAPFQAAWLRGQW